MDSVGVIEALVDKFPGSLGAIIGKMGVTFPSAPSSYQWKGRGHKKPNRKNQLGIGNTITARWEGEVSAPEDCETSKTFSHH